MNYDIVVVGAGPSGLACAIHIKNIAIKNNLDISIAILEKSSSVGANIISGCVMDPKGLDELLPNWYDLDFPINTKVSSEELIFMSQNYSFNLPLPKDWNNKGNYIISLGQLCIKLAEYAESIGVEIYPGFPAAKVIIENNRVVGIVTGDSGLDKTSLPRDNYQPGVEIRADQIVIAEGCRGSLAKYLIKKFQLDQNKCPQSYGLGIKEVWSIKPKKHRPGHIIHSLGYPLNNQAYGGGFAYHFDNNLVSIGLVAALDYKNPYLNPYQEFQKFKLHPKIKSILEGGTCLEYGARTVVEGGVQALPKLSFPGGVLVGDSAGFINVAKIKGVHNAIKSGMLAAQSIIDIIINKSSSENLTNYADYETLVKKSWLFKDLYKVRNIRPAFRKGLWIGLLYSAIDYYILRGKSLWTFKWKKHDHESLYHKNKVIPIKYDNPDGVITFDKMSSVYLSNIHHDDNQPCHLKLADKNIPVTFNLAKYDMPETRYCPSGVYQLIQIEDKPQLQINSQNCIHCKACDIKDPSQNITWVPPEAGSGPQYTVL